GELPLVVGTHALIEETVEFHHLGVVVVDEQHRFGVDQRRALDAKAPARLAPHVLHMTATPIPRTLRLASFGALDVTTLRQLPKGRSEEHTSELQSRGHLVCRLLLEKKKKYSKIVNMRVSGYLNW